MQPDRSLVQLQHVPFPFGVNYHGLASACMLLGDWSSGMIPASGAGGHEFDSRITPFLLALSFLQPPGTPVSDISLGAARREISGGVAPPQTKNVLH